MWYGTNNLHSNNPRRDNKICLLRLESRKIEDVTIVVNKKYRPRITRQRVHQILMRAGIRHQAITYRWTCPRCPRVKWLTKKQCEKKYCSMQCRKKLNIFPTKLRKDFTAQDWKIYWKILNERQSRQESRRRYYLRNRHTYNYQERRRLTGRERYRLMKMQS